MSYEESHLVMLSFCIIISENNFLELYDLLYSHNRITFIFY